MAKFQTDLFCHWIMRTIQFCFAVIILGTAGWLLNLADWNPAELIVPIVFSALAIAFIIPQIVMGLGSKSIGLWLAIAFLDFCIWVGYIASAGLLRNNYNGPGWQNDLAVRLARGNFGRVKIARTVRCVSAFVVMNLILYFFTMVYSLYKAFIAHENKDGDGTARNEKNLRGGHEPINNRDSVASSAPGTTTTAATTAAPGVTRGEYV